MKRWKRGLPVLLAALLLLSPMLAPSAVQVFAPRGAQVELLVVMYHSLVTDEKQASPYVCPISRLESDLAALTARGYRSVTPDQLLAYGQGRGTLPARPLLITLDDGYRNNLTLLPAVLERYDASALLAVVGEYADIYTLSGEDGSLHSCMSWADLRQAAGTPRLELACHAYYFHHLSPRKGASRRADESEAQWRAAFSADTAAIRQALEERCGVTPQCYAYPYGAITPGADDLLRELGFSLSLSCTEQRSLLVSGDPSCLFSLGRYNRDGRLSTLAFLERLGIS